MNVNETTKTLKGLDSKEVLESRKKYGSNELYFKKENGFWTFLLGILKEPMIMLLLVAAIIYTVNGSTSDSIFLVAAIFLVAGISWYQDGKSRHALKALKSLSNPKCKVIRGGIIEAVDNNDLVLGDYLIVEEGSMIAADGSILQSNDFSVDESMLTGESLPLYKDVTQEDSHIYKGTTVTGGLAIAKITAIGNNTKLGTIGNSLEDIAEEKSPLEIQITNFVKKMVLIGAIVFIIVWIINYLNTFLFLESLLRSLTLAMSILPEEIPVAFTTFMALGAWRLMKKGIIVKQMKTVETLGGATVICIDKTGTITENKMTLAGTYTLESARINDLSIPMSQAERDLIRFAMWASEPIPFDPMEVALHETYSLNTNTDERQEYKMAHEYPLEGIPPMMTHIFRNSAGNYIIAAKGAPEAILAVSRLSQDEKENINKAIEQLAKKGYRVLAVGASKFKTTDFPKKQQDLEFVFKGIVAFYDPPKVGIENALKQFYEAGISVKIITGDNAITTRSIAHTIGLKGYEQTMSGHELMSLDENALDRQVQSIQVFTRMFPEAKLRVINALKRNKEIVAMTGDGINDSLALKAAHIGIAMGKKGTEIAKQAAALILLKDDLNSMADAIAMGRRIYANLKKAIRYIISIHVPIILSVFLPLALGWVYPNLLSPVHIIFLELIMGPTCSIIYENEPMEANSMHQKPRRSQDTFFNKKELFISIIQGLMITSATLFVYQYGVHKGYEEQVVRSFVFISLITANITLTFENRSFYYSILKTLRYKNNLVLLIVSATILLAAMLFGIPLFRNFFGLSLVSFKDSCIVISISIVSVLWFEVYKWLKRINGNKIQTNDFAGPSVSSGMTG